MISFNILEVLNEYSIKHKRDGEKVLVLCPFHDDNNPSGELNISTGLFSCWACKKFTNIYGYLAKAVGRSTREIYFTIGRTYYLEKDSPVNPHDVQEWHVALFKNENMLAELSHRCVNEDLIREHRLGFAFDRIAIPIFNDVGQVVNARLYMPGAVKNKFLNLAGRKRKQIRLYPVEQLAFDRILLCGGEIKAVAAAKVLNPHGIGAIAPTCGENTWDLKLNGHFADKAVYVCGDIDETGIKYAEQRCRILKSSSKELYKLILPLDPVQYPKGDINDFLRIGGNLLAEIEKCPPWKLEITTEIDENEEPIEVDLDKAVSAGMAKRRIAVRAVVSSMDTSPYSIPREIEVKCTRDEEYCKICPIYINFSEGEAVLTLGKERIEVIEMVGQELKKQHAVIKKAFSIPARCSVCEFIPHTFYHIEDARISQQLDITSRTTERSMQIAYCLGENRLELNESYLMTGRMYPHPVNQQAALLISEFETTQDALSSYVPRDLDSLKLFSPDEWTVNSLQVKLDDIYSDFEANLTRIFFRRQFHLAIDLAYYSPLFIRFDQELIKGWTEILVIGDSAQGKSKVIDSMLNHYKLGERVVCKNASVAGLMGGLQQYGKRWFATWGKIPTHDRRLVILDELKGTSIEVISALTDMRSTGIAELTKIEKRRTNARTRLIAISNPRSDRPISSYNYGCDTIRELVGNPEDIRRFDLCLILNQDDIDAEAVQRMRPKYEHKYESEICRELILFAWTLPRVEFEDEDFVLDLTVDLCRNYTDQGLPLVDRNSMRLKLARLSAALAARTFSIKDSDTLLVRRCHCEYIKDYLDSIYSNSSFGYRAYSSVIFGAEAVKEPGLVKSKIKNGLIPFPKELVYHLITTDDIDLQFFQDTLGWQANDARNLLSTFVRHHCLKRVERIYRKTTGFTALLKEIEKELEIEGSGRPAHIPTEEF